MSDYIKREDAVFIVLQQPMLNNSVVTEIRLLEGIDIVRCKECKWWASNCYHDNENADKCKFDGYTKADDFCSYGEREGE